jgi:predicted DNA-binding transcriptional regulator YafY
MGRTQRITRINALLSRPQGATLQQMMDELEVSRATINRDLQTLRDEMNAPIVWDSLDRVYRLEPRRHAGPDYMVPGLWLNSAQAYAFLTLHNMVEKIAPNVLGPFLMPIRALLKQLLGQSDFPLYGLDRKIEIDMPAMPAIGDLDFQNLLDALLEEQPARFVIRTKSGLEHTTSGTPVKLRITATGWSINIRRRSNGEVVTTDVADIVKVMAASEEEG